MLTSTAQRTGSPCSTPLRIQTSHASGSTTEQYPRLVWMYRHLLVAVATVVILLLAGATGKPLLPHRHVYRIAFSADGKLLAAVQRSRIRIWETGSGILRLEINADADNPPEPLAFSPDSSMIAAGFAAPTHWTLTGGIVFVWNAQTGEQLASLCRKYNLDFAAGGAMVQNLAYSPDGRYLALGLAGLTPRHKLSVIEAQSGKPVHGFFAGPGTVFPIAFSHDGKLAAQRWSLVSLRPPGPVTVWDLGSGRELASYKGCGGISMNGLAFSRDGALLAAGGSGGRICLWNVETAKERLLLRLGSHARVTTVAFSPDGKMLVSAASDHTLRVWSVDGGRELRRCAIDARFFAIGALSPDARSFAAGDKDDRSAHLWDVDTCRELRRFEM